MEKQQTAKRTWNIVLTVALGCIAAVYLFELIKNIMLKSGVAPELRAIQYIPFAFVGDFINQTASIDVLLKNVLGNFAFFIPLGILLPAFFKKLKFWHTVLIGFGVSLSFETIQYFAGLGVTDIDDLILNTLGCVAGAGLYFGLFYRKSKRLRAKLAACIFLAVFGICGVVALWLYQPSALPTQIVYENSEVLGGTERDSYDISGVCVGANDGAAMLRSGSEVTDGSGAPVPNAAYSYALAPDAALIIQYRSFQYSPNGNIQRTTVRYERATAEAVNEATAASDGAFVDIWLNDAGECEMLLLNVFVEP